MDITRFSSLSSQLQLRQTHQAHYPSRVEVTNQSAVKGQQHSEGSPASTGNFFDLLRLGLEEVNQAERTHASLATQAIINPDQVDAHDVTIAATKADISIRLARNVIDRAISAYREITSLR